MEYLNQHPSIVWLAVALLCGVVEVALPYFTFAFGACGAAVAALVALRFGLLWQGAAFSVATVGSLIFVRPFLRSAGGLPSRTEMLVGRTGEVTVALNPGGRVLITGEDWAARAAGPIEIGRTIKVTGWDGIVLLVEEV